MLFKSLQFISSSSNSTSSKVLNGNQLNQYGCNQVSLLDANICLNVDANPLLTANANVNAHI